MTQLPELRRILVDGAHRLDRVQASTAPSVSPTPAVEPARPGRRRAAPTRRPRRWAIPAAGLVVAALVAAVVIPRLDAPPLEILGAATADAAVLKRLGPGVVGSQTLPESVHPFRTPNGTGYAFETDRGQVCLSIPDSVPDSFGGSCEALTKVAAEGMKVSFEVERASKEPGMVVVVLPRGTSSATWTPAGRAPQELEGENGVVAFSVRADGTLTWKTDGGTHSERVAEYLPQGKELVDCGDGRLLDVIPGRPPREACKKR